MKFRKQFVGWILLAGTALYGLAGCGGTECGPETTEKDGKCVAEVTCGEGTKAENGECVVGDDGCGENATYDAESGTCVPDDGTCSEGTTFKNGQCVANVTGCGENAEQTEDGVCKPDYETICANMGAVKVSDDGKSCVVGTGACSGGTTFNAENGECVVAEEGCGEGLALNSEGTCVPTDDVCGDKTHFDSDNGICLPDETCQMGDEVLMQDDGTGICVRPVEKLADEADTSESENNDPNLGGTANEMTVKDTGNTTVFKGTIGEPNDLDGDGTNDQDIDAFKFDATAGQWFKLAVQANGMPAPWFMIEGPNGWTRQGPTGLEADPARHVAIPQDGTYTVYIQPTASAANPDVGPIGGSDWGYVGSLEQIDAPSTSSVDLTSDSLSGAFPDLSDNYFSIEGFAEGDLIEVSVDTVGDSAEGVLSLYKGDGSFVSNIDLIADETTTLTVPSTQNGAFMALVDWTSLTGPDSDFEISASKVQNVSQVGSVSKDSTESSSKRKLKSDTTATYTFSVGGGQVIELSQTNKQNKAVDAVLLDNTGQEVASFSDMNDAENPTSSGFGPGTPGYMYHYSETGGTFILRLTNTESNELTELQANVKSMTPNDLGTGKAGDTLKGSSPTAVPSGKSAFHMVTLSKRAGLNATIEPDSSKAFVAYLKDSDYERVGRASAYAGTDSLALELQSVDAGVYLLQVDPFEEITSHSVEVKLTEPPVQEQEPNGTDSNATSVPVGKKFEGTTSSGDKDVFSFTLSNNVGSSEVVGIGADFPGETAPTYDITCKVRDSNGSVVKEQTYEAASCGLFMSGISKGQYFFEISTTATDDKAYVGELFKMAGKVEQEPNDQFGNGVKISKDLTGFGDMPAQGMSSDPADYWKVEVKNDLGSSQTLNVDVVGKFWTDPANMDVTLYENDQSTEVDADTTGKPPYNLESSSGLKAGTYFLEIEEDFNFGGVPVGRYQVDVSVEK